MKLKTIQDVLVKEPFDAVFRPADPEISADRVDVKLNVDNLAEPLQLQITIVPKENKDDLPGVEMLHFFVPIPVIITEIALPEVLRLLPPLNLAVPLMAFNYHEDEKIIYFRYVLLIPLDVDVSKVIAETVWLIYFTLDNLGADIAAVAMGKKTVKQMWDEDLLLEDD